MLTGFDNTERRQRMREAVLALRQAADDVAAGRESPAFVGDGVIDLSGPREVNWDAMWSAGDAHLPNPVLPLSSSEAAALRQQFPAPSAAAPVSAPAAPSNGPRFPRGTIVTRSSSRARS
jgi:hypothetical protein